MFITVVQSHHGQCNVCGWSVQSVMRAGDHCSVFSIARRVDAELPHWHLDLTDYQVSDVVSYPVTLVKQLERCCIRSETQRFQLV
jgi:hypothetical protein